MPRERGAIHLTQENYRVNSIWHDRERERGAQCRAVPECSLILFSIHCAQRLEAPEGSPARSLDALSHTHVKTTGSNRRHPALRSGSTTRGRGQPGEYSESGSSGWTCGWGSDSRVGWGRFLSTCLQRRVGSDL